MVVSFDLSQRRRQPEIMDQPGLEENRHLQALRGLERINRWSGSAGILWRPILTLARRTDGPLRLLDVATGGGDVPLRLWHKARRAGIMLQIEGCDRSPCAVAHARRRAAALGAEVRFVERDVLNGPLPGNYDIVVCSLFLHHLDEDQAVDLLRRMAQAADRLLLVNDLRRSLGGWLLAHCASRMLSLSPVVHTDGPLSVAAAFTPPEVRELARRAGLESASVGRRWPCRLLLTWQRGGRSTSGAQ